MIAHQVNHYRVTAKVRCGQLMIEMSHKAMTDDNSMDVLQVPDSDSLDAMLSIVHNTPLWRYKLQHGILWHPSCGIQLQEVPKSLD